MADGTEFNHSIDSLCFPFQSYTISHRPFAIGSFGRTTLHEIRAMQNGATNR
jgi:hypothetical protein